MTSTEKFFHSLYVMYESSDLKHRLLNNQERLLTAVSILGFVGLTLKFFDILTLFYFAVIVSSLGGLIYMKLQKVNQTGLINYMPEKLKNTFMRRSIFDILMDIWYLPTLSEYIKLLIKPVLYKLSPEEATKVLEDFDPSVRKVFLTKGIINLFPNKVKSALLPAETDEIVNQANKTNSVLLTEENHSDSTREDHLVPEKEQRLVRYKQPSFKRPHSRKRKVSINSFATDNTGNINTKLTSISTSTELNCLNPLNEELEREIPIILEEPEYFKESPVESDPNDFRYYEIEDELGKRVIKTIVLESSEKMRKISRVESNITLKDLKEYCWDNIDEYKNREAKKALKNDSYNKTNFIQLLSKSVQQHIISKIDYNKLSKAFVIFLLTFAIQMIVSKRARRWSLSFIQFVVYLTTSLGAGGTLYFLLKKKNVLA